MSNEITANCSIVYEDSEDTEDSLAVVNFIKTVATKLMTRFKQNIGTTEEAIGLSGIASPGYLLAVNRDETNFVNLKVATSGSIFARLDPGGGFAFLRLGSAALVPYAIADTAACQVEFFIVSI